MKQQCEAYVLTSRYCTDCQTFRRIKDYGKRKIRTVYGPVEVSNPRIMNCRRCVPYFCDASAVLRDICPDQATPELMELSARMGSLMPYRKAADVLAEFLPIPSTKSFMTLRHRTMKLGERLDEKARDVNGLNRLRPPNRSRQTRSPERSGARICREHRHGACALQSVRKGADIRNRGRSLRPGATRLAARSLLCDSGHVQARIAITGASSAST